MLISAAEAYFYSNIANQYDRAESLEIIDRVLEHLTGLTKLKRKFEKQIELDESIFYEIMYSLKSGRPIQYALGYEWFYGIKMKVNNNVLIPRPETAELVKWVLDTIDEIGARNGNILDIGTGSGCIALALRSHQKKLNLYALDTSEEALKLAAENALEHQLDIHFIEANILETGLDLSLSFDIIVSNPPYITAEEKREMLPNVLLFEPHLALFVSNNDPLQFYKAIVTFAQHHLNNDGYVFLELNRDYAFQVELIYKDAGFFTELKKDMYGAFRMLKAIKRKHIK